MISVLAWPFSSFPYCSGAFASPPTSIPLPLTPKDGSRRQKNPILTADLFKTGAVDAPGEPRAPGGNLVEHGVGVGAQATAKGPGNCRGLEGGRSLF